VSDEARAYVKTFSQFRNGTFWFHYVMGDIANAQNGYKVWVHADRLIAEWPALTPDIIRQARKTLVEAGELELVEAEAPGRPATYRFTFKQCREMAVPNDREKPARNGREKPVRSSGKSPVVTQPDLLTRTKDPTEPPSGGAAPKTPKHAQPLPEQFIVTGAMKEWLHMNGLDHLDWRQETAQFADHHRARGSTMKDWTAAWRTWMRNAGKWQGKPALNGPANAGYATPMSKKDQLLQHQMTVAAQTREAARANGRH
jgi:hypothetical protein